MKINMFKRAYISVLVGIALIIPGLSGGTILSSSGTLEDLTDNAWSIPKKGNKNLKNNLLVIAVYVAFILVGVVFAAAIVKKMLEEHKVPLYIAFILMMLIAVPAFIKSNKLKRLINGPAVIGLLIILSLSVLDILAPTSGTQRSTILLIVGSVLAGASVLVPGLSGSLMLLLLGQYDYVIGLVNDRSFGEIDVYIFGASALIGLIIVSKILDSIFKKDKEKLINLSWGLVVGSIVSLVLVAIKEISA